MFHLGPDAPASERLMVNEIAPRVHNSGHWTIEACGVSQFENHMRAVAGWPLGSTERHSDAEMVNLIGEEALDWQTLAAEPGACLHLYGKHEARAGPQDGPRHAAASQVGPARRPRSPHRHTELEPSAPDTGSARLALLDSTPSLKLGAIGRADCNASFRLEAHVVVTGSARREPR